ncbi:hypothetical protein M8J75_004246 [Diaphorina citri]|nr:hypothetical protein M8J75_004246 [Diaphorina citri]
MVSTIAFLLLLSLTYWAQQGQALDNGLALTPPMGWMAWQRYRCNTDCDNYPDECISENLFKRMADAMVSQGYKDVGYEYVIIDDCWLENKRGPDGRLEPDKKRFPGGIKALSNYVHSKGLKFGIYEDYGTKTCAGFPGSIDHMKLDAQTFADWEVDYVKLDGCYASVFTMDEGYREFGKYLNETGRPMVYSCSLPAYQEERKMEINFTNLVEVCNLWRNYDDIDDSWYSVTTIANYFALKQDLWTKYAGPGHWNDPDMLIIGNFGLSYEQSKQQMAIWTILAAPLIMSNDLENIKPEFKEILQNKKIIAVNQDPLGIQGRRIYVEKSIEIWTRPITPNVGDKYSYAVAFVSKRTDGRSYPYNVTLSTIGLENEHGYKCCVRESYNCESRRCSRKIP